MVRGKWFASALAVVLSVSLMVPAVPLAYAETMEDDVTASNGEEIADQESPDNVEIPDEDGSAVDEVGPFVESDSQDPSAAEPGEDAETPSAEEEPAVAAVEQDASSGEGQDGVLANSWRFSDGQLITQNGGFRSASNAWTKTDKGYINSYGQVIEDAVKKGVDVSEWNGKIDWAKAKASGQVDFAIIRCGYGSNYADQDDDYWLTNVKECKRLGIPFGVYIYSYATNTSMVQSEANHVIRCLKEAGLSPSDLAYPVFFDMEDDSTLKYKANFAAFATTFCNAISRTGYTPGIYANLTWFNTYLTDSVFNQWMRWVAQYNYQCDYKKEYHFWQCTSSGAIPGFTGNKGRVDINFEMSSYTSIVGEYAIDPGLYYIETKLARNKVVDIASGGKGNGANAWLYAWNGTGAQMFEVTVDDNNLYTFKNMNSGRVLDVAGGKAVSGRNVQQYDSNGSKAQKWKLSKQSDGSYVIRSALKTNLVLDLSGGKTANKTNVQIYSANGTKAQKFEFDPVVMPDESTLADGVYSIAASYADGKVLDIASGSYSNGANVQLYASNKTAAQKFYIAKGKDGFYTIRSLSSGKLLDAANGKLTSPCNVQQWSVASNERNQQWSITDNKDGTRTFINRANGLALDVASASSSNGANIQLYKLNGTKAQKFTIRQVDPLENGSKIRLSSALNTGKGLDVKSGSKSSGANVQLYAWNGTAAQKFEVVKNGDYYSLKALCSGMYLSVSGTNVVQSSNGSSKASLWKPVAGGHGMTFQNAATGKVLDVSGGKTANGTNVQVYKNNGTAAQGFVVKAV